MLMEELPSFNHFGEKINHLVERINRLAKTIFAPKKQKENNIKQVKLSLLYTQILICH